MMSKKLVFLILISGVFLSLDLQSQVKAPFTGDPQKYKEELLAFMGPNLNDEQKANLNNFLAAWDSAAFDRENMIRIIDLSSQFVERAMRPVPYFNDFFSTINTLSPTDGDKDILTKWLTGLSELAFNPRFNNESVDRYIKYTALMVKDNILAETPALKWKVKNAELEYVHDTLFMVIIRDATLTCYSQRDSTEIYNASGIYLPDIQLFHGSAGKASGFPARKWRSDPPRP